MRPLVVPLWQHRVVLIPLGLALMLTYAFFIDAPAWNQNSRFALTRALVETRSVHIDPYHVTTGDKSKRDEHFYCDKAPGVSLLAAIPYAGLYALRRIGGGELPDVRVVPLDPRDAQAGRAPDPQDRKPGDVLVYNFAHRLALYVCGLFAVALPGVLGAAAIWLLAYRHARRDAGVATIVAGTYALATPIFPYATVLYGHGPCAAMLAVGLAIVALTQASDGGRPGLWAGTAVGLAVLTEYPAAVVAIALVVLAAVLHGRRFVVDMVLGGAPWAIVLAAYHTAAFGHPLKTGYDFVYLPEFAEGMAVRYGIGIPQPDVIWQILFGSYRGLLFLSPVLIFAAWGLVVSLKQRDGLPRPVLWLAAFMVVFYVLLNGGYYMWDGGASFGPRHVVPMLGAVCLGLVPAYRVAPRAVAIMAVVSVVFMLMGATANPEAPRFGNPLWEFAWGRVIHGSTGATAGATNLGRLLGLPGALSLLPLVIVWWWAWPAKSDRESEAR